MQRVCEVIVHLMPLARKIGLKTYSFVAIEEQAWEEDEKEEEEEEESGSFKSN